MIYKINTATCPMLEEVGVQILVETVLKLHTGRFPIYFVSELDLCSTLELNFSLGREINIHNSVVIEANVKFLVCPQVIGFMTFTYLANNAWKKIRITDT